MILHMINYLINSVVMLFDQLCLLIHAQDQAEAAVIKNNPLHQTIIEYSCYHHW